MTTETPAATREFSVTVTAFGHIRTSRITAMSEEEAQHEALTQVGFSTLVGEVSKP